MTPIESTLFVLKKIVSTALLPPVAPLLLIAAGLVFARRHRAARVLAWSGVVILWLLATPAVVRLIADPLQDMPALDLQALRGAQAIVILGCDRNFNAPEYGGQSVGRMALERLRLGARLARQSGLPVLVTGGSAGVGQSEAVLMKATLEDDFGVTVRWVEPHALDTADNARLSAKLLSADGVQRVVLVTHALHMKRALREFSAAGLTALAAPTGRYDGNEGAFLGQWQPSASAAYFGRFALHEWLGQLAAGLRK